MRIAFSLYGIGLGNNGGSRTIVKSANVLVEQGHEVFIFSHCKNGYTWDELKAKHMYSRTADDFPRVDVLVATGAKTAFHVWDYPYKRLGAYWIRGIEVWSNPFKTLMESYELPLLKMTNSEWQKEYILSHLDTPTQHKIHIQYPGLETEFLTPADGHLGFRFRGMGREKPFAIGGLYHAASHKGFKSFVDITRHFPEETIRILSATPISVGKNWDLIVQPTEYDKRSFYRNCSVWLATTSLDGLHLPPMEAGLCGAALVCNAKPSSGMSDHAIHKETALCFITPEEAVMYIKTLKQQPRLRKRLNESHRQLLHQKMGSREYQMEKMIALFDEHLA
jgi:hypothetical protein